MNVSEDRSRPPLPKSRVATRHGVGGVAEERRRLYQRHLLIFLGFNGALVAADLLTAPGLQWAHFLAFPWVVLFLVHTFGLKSRGYTLAEMFIPPRRPEVKEVYTTPLDYEVVRSRQLHDGIATAAAAIREKHGDFVDRIVSAADELVEAVETAVSARRARGDSEDAGALTAEAQSALAALDGLHRAVLSVEVLEEPPDEKPVEVARERAAALRTMSEEPTPATG